MEFSKDLFLKISESVNDLICILNSDLEIEYINEPVFKKILGYSNDDLLGSNVKNLIDIDEFNKLFKILDAIYKIKENSAIIRILDEEGNYNWFDGKVIRLSDKEERRFLLILRDISEWKIAESTLKDSKEKYQSLVENIKEGYYEVDLNGDFTFVNDALCEFVGYSRAELIGESYNKLMKNEKIGKLVFKTYNDVFRTEIQQNIFQFQVLSKKGVELFLEASVYLKNDSKGKKIGFYGIIRDITQRIKEEEIEEQFKVELTKKVRLKTSELQESEEKYKNLFHHSNDAIFLHDLDGNILDVNQKAVELFDYTKSEFLALKIAQLHPTSELVESKKAFEEISMYGYIRFEINFQKKNGEIFPAEVSSSLIYIGEKKVIQGIVRDITARKQSELKLKESELKYRNMITNLDLGFYQVNWNGDLLNYNPAFSYILGFDATENLEKINVSQFWQHPEEREIYLIELEKEGHIENFVVHSKKKNGQDIVLQLNSHLISDSEGKPTKIQGVISDITEKFELEQRLKDSENRYRNLIESVPFSIALIDQSGKVIYCNPATEVLLGYNESELIGHEFKSLPAVPPKYLPTMLKRFNKVASGEHLPPFDAELYKKNGSLIWVTYQTNLLKLGETPVIQAIINDVTERKKADLLIQEEIKKLKELDQIRKDLISRVSHELKTPLVSVCGASELLLDLYKEQLKGDVKELIEMIEKGGRRLRYLVDNLLDITRIEYSKFELKKEMTDLGNVVRNCINEMMYLIKNRQLNLDLNIQDNVNLEIDKVRIEQVILNLLSNAIKNTPPNGTITIKLFKNGNFAEFAVCDTGIGLTREEMDRIFTRFGKIERYGEGLEYIDIQGSGLGLYISKEIIDLHEGQIWAESSGRDQGCTFNVKLPS